MKLLVVLVVSFLLCAIAEARDIQLFNPDVLGQQTSRVVKLVEDKKVDETEPLSTIVNIKNGVYFAATVIYPKEVTFQDPRESLNRILGNYEKQSLLRDQVMAVWRVEDKKYAISLIKDKEQISILYIQFQTTDDIMKTLKSMGMPQCTDVQQGP